MTEHKWTQGPWSVRRDECDDPVVVSECLGLELDGLCWHENSDANAHLIAAAPELYEALERLLPMAEDDCFQYGSSADNDEDVLFARAALAKARGEK